MRGLSIDWNVAHWVFFRYCPSLSYSRWTLALALLQKKVLLRRHRFSRDLRFILHFSKSKSRTTGIMLECFDSSNDSFVIGDYFSIIIMICQQVLHLVIFRKMLPLIMMRNYYFMALSIVVFFGSKRFDIFLVSCVKIFNFDLLNAVHFSKRSFTNHGVEFLLLRKI